MRIKTGLFQPLPMEGFHEDILRQKVRGQNRWNNTYQCEELKITMYITKQVVILVIDFSELDWK